MINTLFLVCFCGIRSLLQQQFVQPVICSGTFRILTLSSIFIPVPGTCIPGTRYYILCRDTTAVLCGCSSSIVVVVVVVLIPGIN